MRYASLLALPATILLAMPSVANAASLRACGDVHVEAEAECELVAEGCDVQCSPLSVEASCAASLAVECGGSCNLDAEVSCTGDCRASCEAECRVDPGAFDCAAGCQLDCGANCEARCDASDSECRASCQASCDAECDASCEVVPPDADCVTSCEACCGGSCTAAVNLDCQIDCQAEGFAECSVDVEGGCKADCSDAGGALFCDGDYIDHGGNLNECIDALKGILDGEISGSASAQCSGGECSFESEGALSCAVDPNPQTPIGLALGVFVGLALFGRRRR